MTLWVIVQICVSDVSPAFPGAAPDPIVRLVMVQLAPALKSRSNYFENQANTLYLVSKNEEHNLGRCTIFLRRL
jgi:hypothetical protein